MNRSSNGGDSSGFKQACGNGSPWSSEIRVKPQDDITPKNSNMPPYRVTEKIEGAPRQTDTVSADTVRVGGDCAGPRHAGNPHQGGFVPIEPDSFRQAGLTDSEVEALVMKCILSRGDISGRDLAEQVKLPFVLVDRLLRQLKSEQLVVHRAAAPMNDFQYQLSELGRERARRYAQHCSYFGSAPVALKDYIASVDAQSLTKQHPTAESLHLAFADLLLNKKMLDRLGPAINSGRGLFLYGAPGNGKTSIAERVTRAFGQLVWIPRDPGGR